MQNIKKLSFSAVICALAVVAVLAVHFPIFPAVSFLEYDPGDIAVLFAGLLLGPWWGLGITLVVSLVQGITVSAASGVYGILMHIISTGTLVLVSALAARLFKGRLNAELSVLCGVLAAAAVMVGANLLITPLFMGVTMDDVLGIMLPFILPFNLIKLGVNGALACVVYRAFRESSENLLTKRVFCGRIKKMNSNSYREWWRDLPCEARQPARGVFARAQGVKSAMRIGR